MSVEVRREMLVRYLREQAERRSMIWQTTLILPAPPFAATCDS